MKLCSKCGGEGAKIARVIFTKKEEPPPLLGGQIYTEMRKIVCKYCLGTGYSKKRKISLKQVIVGEEPITAEWILGMFLIIGVYAALGCLVYILGGWSLVGIVLSSILAFSLLVRFLAIRFLPE